MLIFLEKMAKTTFLVKKKQKQKVLRQAAKNNFAQKVIFCPPSPKERLSWHFLVKIFKK